MRSRDENLLSNQNVTKTTNITWAVDITTLRLFRSKKAFLCIDIHTNYIVASLISKRTITTQSITRSLERNLNRAEANSFLFLPRDLLGLILCFPFNTFNDSLEYSRYEFDVLHRPYQSRKPKLHSSYDAQSFDAQIQYFWCPSIIEKYNQYENYGL